MRLTSRTHSVLLGTRLLAIILIEGIYIPLSVTRSALHEPEHRRNSSILLSPLEIPKGNNNGRKLPLIVYTELPPVYCLLPALLFYARLNGFFAKIPKRPHLHSRLNWIAVLHQ